MPPVSQVVNPTLPGVLFGKATTADARLLVVYATLIARRYRYQCERELQDGLAVALEEDGIPFSREVPIGPRDRIDFLCGDVGVEVKIKGGPTAVMHQLTRYAEPARIGALLCVSDRVQLARLDTGNRLLGGKPFRVLPLFGGIV